MNTGSSYIPDGFRQYGAAVTAVLVLLFSLLFPASDATAAQGDRIVNTAFISQSGTPAVSTSASVTVVIPTPATIEFLLYAPGAPGAQPVPVAPGAYRSGAAPTSPFVALPFPQTVGSLTPIDLNQPVPLVPASQVHQGDPLFIRVTDLDQNLDRTLRETILVTVTNPASGDIEVVLLSETGPDTGVFAGYLPTTPAASGPYNGSIRANQANQLTARYQDPDDATDAVTSAIMVDPYGIVFDSSSGLPVNGAAITILNTVTGLPATVYGDNGVSTFPSTVTSGGTFTDGSGTTYTFAAGAYRFPLVPPGSYRYVIAAPAGYSAPSTVPASAIPPPFTATLVTGSRGESFTVSPGPAVRIDIPLDPSSSSLWLQKSVAREFVGIGEFVPYELTITNPGTLAQAIGVRVTDLLPAGFRYRKGSAQLDGLPAADPSVSADGRTLVFQVDRIPVASSRTVRYVTEVTAGSRIGPAVNQASATASGGAASNLARATVKVRDDLLRTRATLMGRVTVGDCPADGGEPADGREGVRIYLEDGTFVISDKQGLFHFEGIRPGLHVVQLDLDSLPDGYEAVSCTENSRFAGRSFSQFVEVQGGSLWRSDFHIRPRPEPPIPSDAPVPRAEAIPVSAPPAPAEVGRVSLDLSNHFENLTIVYTADMKGAAVPLSDLRLSVTLPPGVSYTAGSSTMDGVAIADPEQDAFMLVYRLGSQPAGFRQTLTFKASITPGSTAGRIPIRAYLAGDGPSGRRLLTAPAESSLEIVKEQASRSINLTMHPRFATLSDELGSEDKESLNELAILLTGLSTERIIVTGHTDNLRIAPRKHSPYRNNTALSWGRARSVGRYLLAALRLPPEKLVLDGKGESAPVADNLTEEGRAKNRRVEVQVFANRRSDRYRLGMIQEQSSVQSPGEASETAAVPGTAVEQASSQKNTVPGGSAAGSQGTVSAGAAAVNPPPGGSAHVPAATAVPADPPAAAPPVGLPGATPLPPLPAPDGLLFPADGDLLVERINPVRIRLDSSLLPRLTVDGREVLPDRIGFKSADPVSGKTTYGYIGVDFGDPGRHTILVQGVDPFGNARATHSASVTRTGDITTIRLISAEGNVADGRTPVRMRFELLDQSNTPIRGATRLEFRDGTLVPPRDQDGDLTLEDKAARRWINIDRDGWVSFQPVTTSGSYRAVIAYNTAVVEAETYVQPKLRDWILVGLAEGTLGYNTVSGNVESLKAGEANEDFYKDGRVAFFAKGQIQGKWLLTMSYDTAKSRSEVGSSLFQNIDPDSYYTLYGDSGQQSYDAASARKLYVKIERDQFYAMLGDFDTGLTITELSRYSRRMTGIKTELQTKHVEVSAFASETTQTYQRDEIPGDGTSGLYRLSRKNIIANSEKITILVRDRFHSETILSSRTLGRFSDYSIDYDAGTLFFKEPVQSKDSGFNPVTILVEYEAGSDVVNDYTYGGRAGLKLLDKRLKIGATYLHEGMGEKRNDLYGSDISLQINESTMIRGETASTRSHQSGVTTSGLAYLAELQHTSKKLDVRLYIREQQSGFGLGQQMGSESGTRKFGITSAYRLSDTLSISGQAYRQTMLSNGAERDEGDLKLTYGSKRYSLSVGLLQATDHLTDGSSKSSGQITLGGKLLTLDEKLTLTLDHAQSVWDNSNSDYPTRTTLGAEYKISSSISLFAAQELSWGKTFESYNTRAGIRSTPWKGATLSSSMERQLNENSSRLFANIGLRQTWQLSDAWKVDAGVDRSQTINRSGSYSLNTGGILPAVSDEFTALSTGASYQVKKLVWDSRFEYRTSSSEDKFGILSGIVAEKGDGWAWSARGQLLQADSSIGVHSRRGNLRFGLVYRPARTEWIHLNRLDIINDEQRGAGTDLISWRLVNNYNANFKLHRRLQVSLKYGAKYVVDTISGKRYSAFTDHIGSEMRYDLTKKWDVGARGSVLHSWSGGQYSLSGGVAAGYNLMENAWVSIGYNLWGFTDKDFSAADYTAQGPYIRFRLKFDQQSVKDAALWLNKQ